MEPHFERKYRVHAASYLGDGPRAELAVLNVSSAASSDSLRLRGGVHGDEDDVGFLNLLLNVGAEEEVLAAAGFNDGLEAGLVDGKGGGVPGGDLGGVKVDDGYADLVGGEWWGGEVEGELLILTAGDSGILLIKVGRGMVGNCGVLGTSAGAGEKVRGYVEDIGR